MTLFYILIALLIGIGIPLQTTVNSRLREYVKYPLLASLVAFGVGAIFLLLLSLITNHSILVPSEVFRNEPWWIWLGGALGVLGLTANILLFPRIGGVQTVIIPMLGQIIMSTLIDSFGWFHSPHLPFTFWRAIGIVLVVAGIFMVIMLKSKPKDKEEIHKVVAKRSNHVWVWQLIGIAAGMLVAARSAINGQLGVVLESSVQAGLISLIIGTIFLLPIILLLRQGLGNVVSAIKANAPWWVWTGGVLGALFIVATAFLVPILGTGTVVIVGIFGQLSCSLAIDKYGLLGAQKRPVTLMQIMGLMLLLAGVIIIRVL